MKKGQNTNQNVHIIWNAKSCSNLIKQVAQFICMTIHSEHNLISTDLQATLRFIVVLCSVSRNRRSLMSTCN